ncbi:MAG: 16S rRNA (guanine(966)-N(2))-methyltransferase RsmD [Acidobacteria bacterium RIFCSPHIGHO2_12_FULL_67_30]|nr:MAG: 16S rRNA (guanine(966)-N(2))-methyltransferase RsmD [Acidobacteria bacterium RIFCSPHIGHO2_02_FULL_67_57]OFV83874.1 MAG: 16S rRNA (guanine(966)-N(2))-methyltransferase RsmD [Acidobacteria bacterium RIFCSPHIGHO2_01_FULL_67_28]OFV87704.1 MAG: 16S rRNA (guanine(966)-N(2))-methyltransferase RsmD [Acidobacteria bacterium RIFCSPHIGHO2_12_FULL_67_30]
MRIIAGRFRSRQLKTLRGAHTRPTSDRLRETLFNVLGAGVAGAVAADCYAGSGAVGLEALSRGAEWVYFLENHRPAVKVIGENLKRLEIETGAEVLAFDVLAGLGELERRGVRLDVVFLDPPYQAAEEYERALGWLGRSGLLAPEAWVVAEHSRRGTLKETYGALARIRALRQGDAVLSFFRPSD